MCSNILLVAPETNQISFTSQADIKNVNSVIIFPLAVCPFYPKKLTAGKPDGLRNWETAKEADHWFNCSLECRTFLSSEGNHSVSLPLMNSIQVKALVHAHALTCEEVNSTIPMDYKERNSNRKSCQLRNGCGQCKMNWMGLSLLCRGQVFTSERNRNHLLLLNSSLGTSNIVMETEVQS